MSLWYKKLGFYNNPFSIKPAAFDNTMVAYDLGFIFKKIENGEMLFIEGVYGTGKTTILKSIINQFRRENKIIYYNFNKGNGFDLNKLVDGANSFLRKVTGLKVKNIIMLLDEVHALKVSEAKQLLDFYKDGTLKSIIFVTHDYDLMKFPEEFSFYLNGNILKTVNLNNKEAVDLIRKRIGSLDIIDDKTIIELFRLSGNNPRRLLAYCEDVMRFAVEIGDDKITPFHVEEILKDVIEEKKPRKKQKPASKKPLTNEKKEEPQKAEAKVAEAKKEEPQQAEAKKEDKKPKKFKVNKLVEDSKKNSLGTIESKEIQVEEEPVVIKEETNDSATEKTEDEIPEYQIYFLDNE